MTMVLKTDRLRKDFGGLTAVNDVSIDIRDNEFTSIIGPNGAGKTTFFNLLTGRLRPSSGRIWFEQRDITGRPPHVISKMGIARIFQINNLFPASSTFENVRIAVQAHTRGNFSFFQTRESLTDVTAETNRLLQQLELTNEANELSMNLSHGCQRMLEIAIALAGKPRLLLLDEPTAGMSPDGTKHVTQIIKELSRTVTTVLVEHDMEVVMAVSDRIIVLHQGSIIADGTPQEVRCNPEVKKAYLGEENDFAA